MKQAKFLLLFFLSFYSAFSQDIESGLVAYYPLDGDATDQSGNNLDGTIFGAVSTSDRFGLPNTALNFDGEDDYILVEDDDLLDFGTGTFAVSLWVKASNPNGGSQMLLQKGDSGPGAGQFWFRIKDFTPSITFKFSTTEGNPPATELTSTQSLFNDEKWHHIVVQRLANRLEFWLDCQLVEELTDIPNRNVDGSGNLIIGAQNAFLNGMIPEIHNFFNGSLDEIRVYNRALTPIEILEVSNTYCPDILTLENDLDFCLYQASGTINTSGNIVVSKASKIRAGTSIIFNPGFTVTNGAQLTATIDDCNLVDVQAFSKPQILPDLGQESSIEKISRVFPNPFESGFQLEFLHQQPEEVKGVLSDNRGQVLKMFFISQEKSMEVFDIQVNELPAGMYFLLLKTSNKNEIHKLVKVK